MKGFIEIEIPEGAELRYLININHIITLEQLMVEDDISSPQDPPVYIECTKFTLNIVDKTEGELCLVKIKNGDDYKVFSSELEYRTFIVEIPFEDVIKMIKDAQ